MHIVHILSTCVILYGVLPRLSVKYRKMVLTGFVTLGSAFCTKLFCRGCWWCCRGCCCLPTSTFIRSCHSREKKINPYAALNIFCGEKSIKLLFTFVRSLQLLALADGMAVEEEEVGVVVVQLGNF